MAITSTRTAKLDNTAHCLTLVPFLCLRIWLISGRAHARPPERLIQQRDLDEQQGDVANLLQA